jgi:regulation of enolase protein 1 (concanavalin A-like superfamily)
VRITPERVVIVNAELGSIWGVAVTNISLISFPTNGLSTANEEVGDGSLPAPWEETDIGVARLPGSTRHESGIFTVRSSGMNIDGEGDAFHYVFKAVRGDSEIVAEVVSIQYSHPFAKAGLMMRENLNEYSRNVTLALTAERGGALQYRMAERAYTDSTSPRALFAPMWLKLRRQSNEFTAYVSPNGRLWSLFERVSVPMSEKIYVGLAVAGAQDGMLNWTTFSKVREAPRLLNESFTPEVELISGSVVTGRPVLADENEVVFVGAPKVVRVPVPRVARMSFQLLSGDISWKTRVSRPGVWVSNGDFFDGDFRGIEGRKLTISSVLYGLRTFDLDEEVLAVVLQPRRLRRAPFEIETADGATLVATELTLGDGELRLSEPALGELRVPAFEILEVRRR